MLPLFWLTEPLSPHGPQPPPQPFATATLGPLMTTGAEYADWSALLLAEFDWSADCDVSEPFEQHEWPPATVWL